MTIKAKRELARCPNPKCGKPIWDDHPYSWCAECGEPLPEGIRAQIPQLQRLAAEVAQERARRAAQAGAPPARFPLASALVGLFRVLAVVVGLLFLLVIVLSWQAASSLGAGDWVSLLLSDLPQMKASWGLGCDSRG
jgi:hypothetical protein